MKKTLWNILQIVLKTALAGALFVSAWIFLTPYFRIDRNKDGDYFRNLPDHIIDVIALGSSHMQYAFDPAQFYTETGDYAYVLGSSCQPFSESYYMLKEALKSQHPSVVLVDVFTLLPQSSVCYANGMYYKAVDMMSGENRLEAAEEGIPVNEEVSQETKNGYVFDLLMNHSNWKTMDLSDLQGIIENARPAEGYHWELGYVRQEPKEFKYTPVLTYAVTEKIQLSDDEKKWIDAFIDLCDEEKIHLIFVKTPYLINQADTNKLSAVWNYLDEKGADYIDLVNHTEEYDWFMDMDGDTWHNNTWGAEIVTKAFAQYIKENHLITDHKDDETFESLVQGSQRLAAHSLMGPANINIYRLVDEASKYPCITILRSKAAEKNSVTEYMQNALKKIGFTHDYLSKNDTDYYAVAVNHKLIKESNEPFSIQVKDLYLDLQENATLINGENYDEQTGEFEITFLSDTTEWVNPIPIDYSKPVFWKKGCTGWACTVEHDER